MVMYANDFKTKENQKLTESLKSPWIALSHLKLRRLKVLEYA